MSILRFMVRIKSVSCCGTGAGLLCAIMLVPGVGLAREPGVIRADGVFLKQLLNREFFDLAKHHCVAQQHRATTATRKAEWQLRLGEIYEQHAWFSVAANRNSLLSHAALQITEFLASNKPSLENEFLLRIQQARLLGQSVRMSLVVEEGGKLFGRDVAIGRSFLPAPAVDSRRVATLDKGLELLDSLLRQLETLRRDLDPVLSRKIRDMARLEKAEFLLLKWRTVQVPNDLQGVKLKAECADLIESALRASIDKPTKARCRLLLAEAALLDRDQKTFELRVRSIAPEDVGQTAMLPGFLVARGHLFRQESHKAERALESISPAFAIQVQQLTWLSLECALGERELAGELNNPTLMKQSAEEFDLELAAAGRMLKGVFREAAERTATRFTLVSEVGVEVADLVEQVEVQRSKNDLPTALRLIKQALAKLSPDAQRPRAALLLRAGEIHLANGSWADASRDLVAAERLFGKQQMSAEQAAADLLQIYALGQQMSTYPEVSNSGYVARLEQHVVRFSEEPTVNRAREWLFQAVESTDAVRAASLALELYRSETNPRKVVAALERIGELVLNVESGSDTGPGHDSIVAEFLAEVGKLEDDSQLYPAIDLVVLRIQKLDLTLPAAVGQNEQMDGIAAELAAVKSDLSTSGQLDPSQVIVLQERLSLINAVVIARTASSADEIRQTEDRLMATPDDRLADVIQFLAKQYESSTRQPGDVWLARVNDQLLRRLLIAADLSMLIQYLGKARETSDLTEDTKLMDSWMRRLLSHQLSQQQVVGVATVLSQPSGRSKDGASGRLIQFWNQVADSHTAGNDLWLESQFRLARMSMLSGREAAARKRLAVVSAIYPNWGSADRKKQVELLLEK